MAPISLGYSPCPNDTYIFYGLVHNKIEGAPQFTEVLEDIETLNTMATNNQLDMTKISFHALGHLRDRYCLLHSGGALGRGCGPLVISREPLAPEDLAHKKIAIPGKLTTAALLLQLFDHNIQNLVVLPFHEIMSATQSGDVDAGLIIHESRFTYPDYGLHKVIDLGEWWESATGHPIPLGGILARRDLGSEIIQKIDQSLRASVEFAHSNPNAVKNYIRQHAQEMDENVMQQHIDLYVNDYTLDYSTDGEAAITDLYHRAEVANIIPPSDLPIFMS
ncbi:MAG: 1,4-dihydroxy-6-naphthoate synthase [Candidatus Latescibacteria bacterium]|jgi:1,4-dihydroxy-6-naphthoate synthase|nr:1,4-dihydroxy-6-naphthoate synthase [Candidatus Latescibacterota bacterium]MBT4139228.1 1,4-dihydroxy-6-naphthoate synthase [Candidatus Latescibacterota bacterium]MBT5829852.1 1,4-dihydroxy-6-naphthoate synthase [Candidatus Latescibacterota bacterium]